MATTTGTKKKFRFGWIVWVLAVLFCINWIHDRKNGGDPSGRVPEAYRSHTYMQKLDAGHCERLLGNVVVTAVFVNDGESSWDNAAMVSMKTQLAEAANTLVAEAAGYGQPLQIKFDYRRADITASVDRTTDNVKDCLEAALSDLKLPGLKNAQRHLEQENGVEENPMVFLLNKSGRSFKSGFGDTEYVLLYNSASNARTFRHELLHIYSAFDYYYPAEAKTAANTYFPDSVMNSGEKVDDLAAFHIGWTETLTENAKAFLEDTADITQQEKDAAHKVSTTTGYVTDHAYGDGLYTGNLVFGYPHGIGKWVKEDGSSYDGQWNHGTYQGTGVFTWSDGDRYEGGFADGKLHGTGTLYYTDGGSYTGDWVQGKRTGKGVMQWASGSRYEGDWLEDKRTGKGVFTWSDGGRYEGDFADGQMTGYGTMHYKNGDVYTGNWENGKRHGQGTYTWASGSKKTGTWSEGEFVG